MINADYMNKPNNIYDNNGETTLNIDPVYFDQEQYDLTDDRDFSKYIKDIERVCRNSFEYKWLIHNLKTMNGMDQCAVLEGVSSRNDSKVKIELHHHPLTLYDIVMAVVRKRIKNNESIDIFAVANEVMYNHYLKHVGLIPLSQTVHEMVHNQFYFIPTDRQFGNYRPFVESYYNELDPEVLDALDNAEQATKDGAFNNQNDVFNNHNIYIQQRDFNREEYINNIKPKISERIDDIKNNNNTLKEMCTIEHRQT